MLRLRAGTRRLSGSEFHRRARNSKTPTTATVQSIPRNDHLPLIGGPQVLMTDDVGCLCATFHHVQQSCSMKTSVHQHGELELYSVGDFKPVEFVAQQPRQAAIKLPSVASDAWQAPLGVRSAKCRHQSPEWTILSHSYRLIQGEIVRPQVMLDSLHPCSSKTSQWSPPVLRRGSRYDAHGIWP